MKTLQTSPTSLKTSLSAILFMLLAVGCAGTSGVAQSPSETPSQVEVYSPIRATDTPESTGMCADDKPCAVSTTDLPQAVKTIAPLNPDQMIETPTTTLEPQPRPTLDPKVWMEWPVIPMNVSAKAKAIYQQGLANGNYADRFSKIGDCQNINTYFLALYDDTDAYTLGEEYAYLQNTIDYYSGMWSRDSISVKNGFNVANIFNPWFNNKELCDSNETPIDCELRINQPSVVLVSMEAWWNGDPERYAMYYRRIVETVLAHNAVPILATKADNLEGENAINQAIAQIAAEYDVPLWNFWLSVQDIPEKGLEEDGFHITHGINDFSNPENLERAWPLRNLTALQAIDAVRLALQQP